ncbi:MAG: TatD family nuclease-associated radical SAM protein [Oscillospiraceae bacterium]|nr:TatD family nuclease-associated radical SAM protein [Oscillospiraceae bacterium]
MSIVYTVGDGLYINLTNRCTADCDFCVRNFSGAVGDADTLWLDAEPSAEQVLAEISGRALEDASEIVFCGFGEPTLRLGVLLDVARALKERRPGARVRVNTNGHASLIHGGDVTPRLSGLIDALSVSLNFPDAESYNKHCRPAFGLGAHAAVIDFASRAKQYVPEVTLTVLDTLGADETEACRAAARRLGVGFRIRHEMR